MRLRSAAVAALFAASPAAAGGQRQAPAPRVSVPVVSAPAAIPSIAVQLAELKQKLADSGGLAAAPLDAALAPLDPTAAAPEIPLAAPRPRYAVLERILIQARERGVEVSELERRDLEAAFDGSGLREPEYDASSKEHRFSVPPSAKTEAVLRAALMTYLKKPGRADYSQRDYGRYQLPAWVNAAFRGYAQLARAQPRLIGPEARELVDPDHVPAVRLNPHFSGFPLYASVRREEQTDSAVLSGILDIVSALRARRPDLLDEQALGEIHDWAERVARFHRDEAKFSARAWGAAGAAASFMVGAVASASGLPLAAELGVAMASPVAGFLAARWLARGLAGRPDAAFDYVERRFFALVKDAALRHDARIEALTRVDGFAGVRVRDGLAALGAAGKLSAEDRDDLRLSPEDAPPVPAFWRRALRRMGIGRAPQLPLLPEADIDLGDPLVDEFRALEERAKKSGPRS